MSTHNIGTEVTLWEDHVYDSTLTISTEDVAEVIGYAPYENDDRIIIAFQELVDEEGVTPTIWIDPVEVERAPQCSECGCTLGENDLDYGSYCASCG